MVTLAELAKAKGFPIQFLKSLGLYDYGGDVMIPYLQMDGSLARTRIRIGVGANNGSRWDRGGEVVPYGLHRLAEARKTKKLIIVEGESDCWTLWQYGFCALGMPGASMSSKIKPEYIQGIETIYLWIEPDKGGDTLRSGLLKKVFDLKWPGTLREVKVPNVKDPNEWYLHDKKYFRKNMIYALNGAKQVEPYVPPAPKNISRSNVGNLDESMIRKAAEYPLDKLVEPERGYIICPFHNDKHASMWVKNGYAYCFVCNKSMNSILYLQKVMGLSFPEAVRRLQ